MTNLNLKEGDRVKTPCGHFGTVRRVIRYVVDFDQDTPNRVSLGNCFNADGTQAYPGEGKATRIDPVPAFGIGDKLRWAELEASVIAFTPCGDLLVQRTNEADIYRINPTTLKETFGGVWEIVKPVVETVRFWNVYADGSLGPFGHETFEDALDRSAYGKVRVGVLQQTKREGAIVDAAMLPTVPTLRTPLDPEGINPFAEAANV